MRALPLLVLLAASCSDGTVDIGDGTSILVAPTALDFGEVTLGEPKVRSRETVTVLSSLATNSMFSVPFVELDLAGQGVDDGPLIAAREIDFGPTGLSCGTATRTITFYNDEAATVVLDAITVDEGTSFATPGLPFPLRLAPGSSYAVPVSFRDRS